MDVIPRNDYGERCQFDAYCKLVLYHEAIDYLREMQRHRDRELSFSDLSQVQMDKLYTIDHYPSDGFTFSSHGYDLHIDNELVAEAFAGLSSQEQSILILTVFWNCRIRRSAALWECPAVPYSGEGQNRSMSFGSN